MGRLDGKVAIITGASQGMGEAHARRFVAEGARVVLTDINDERGQEIAAELGENARFVKADVTNPADWRQVVVGRRALPAADGPEGRSGPRSRGLLRS